MPRKRKTILILGAGFAGLRVARLLARRLDLRRHSIVLVDRFDTHLYTPDLYEIATAFHEHITDQCLMELKETVATPIESMVAKRGVEFIQAEVTDIHPKTKTVKLKGRAQPLAYDVLVSALGSQPTFFDIPGLEQYSHPVKTIRDGLVLNCKLDRLFYDATEAKRTAKGRKARGKRTPRGTRGIQPLTLIVGGGGPNGVELVGELAGYVNHLCVKYNVPRSKVHVELIEGGDTLAAMKRRGTQVVLKRFEQRGVTVRLNQYITKVSSKNVTLKGADKKRSTLPYDLLIWTGGVKANALIRKTLGNPDYRGLIEVKPTLQSVAHPSVFAAGDNAYFAHGRSGRPLPMMAQVAVREADTVAANVVRFLNKEPLKPYRPMTDIYVIPIGGRFGLCKIGPFVFKGRWCWTLRRFITLKYSLSILPPWKALRKWLRGREIYVEND